MKLSVRGQHMRHHPPVRRLCVLTLAESRGDSGDSEDTDTGDTNVVFTARQDTARHHAADIECGRVAAELVSTPQIRSPGRAGRHGRLRLSFSPGTPRWFSPVPGITSLRPDLTTVPSKASSRGTSSWPPAPATTAASSRPSANAPKLTSPDPAPPNQRASLPHEPRTNRRRTRNADGTFDLSRRRVRHEQ